MLGNGCNEPIHCCSMRLEELDMISLSSLPELETRTNSTDSLGRVRSTTDRHMHVPVDIWRD